MPLFACRIALCLLLVLPAAPALAGAWQREAGTGFASAAVRFSWPQDITTWTDYAPTSEYRSFYLEYGLSPRVTAGLDLGMSISGSEKAVAFVQYPLRNRDDAGPKIAMEMGVGQIEGQQVLRPGLSLGWGRARGWLSVDALAEIAYGTGETDVKLDITLGLAAPGDRRLITQLQTGDTVEDPPFVRLETTLVRPVIGPVQAEMGVLYGVWGDSSMGVKLGVWTEF